MEKITVKNDIYDKFGRLYIKKDTQIDLTKYNLLKFKELGVLEQLISEDNSIEELKMLQEIANEFKEKHNNLDEETFNQAVNLVHNIIFVSKNLKWYSHLNTLINHSEWFYSHAINTGLIAAMIALKLEYNENDIREIVLGAIFHDIGMILIPKEILCKGEELAIEEKYIVNRHCELGVSMLSDCEFPELSKEIILQHHEKIDGSGYPNALDGESILEQSQIVMIADEFDTSTTYNTYKSLENENSAVYDILESGDRYSPNIIECFKELMY